MRTHALLAAAVLVISALPSQPVPQTAANPLTRKYREGEEIRYLMKGDNNGRRYQATAVGVVKTGPNGRFVEEVAWSDAVVNGVRTTLSAANATFRQELSLDPGYTPSIPNLAAVDPQLIGPVLDLMNFYVDLQLASKQASLTRAGSHVLVLHGKPNSWADGRSVVLGQDAIDFDITLTSLDPSANTAVVTVRHVPPAQASVQLPAPWMKTPVADTPNNWVQVVKTENGYQASVGKETFDVRITVSLADGSIRSATMNNPVELVDRTCNDAALTDCGPSSPRRIHRAIELTALAR